MKTILRVISFVLLSAATVVAGEETTNVLSNLQAEKDYAAAVEKAQKEYDAKVTLAIQKLIPILKSEQDKYTKKGDLDNALVVKKRIEELQSMISDGSNDAKWIGKWRYSDGGWMEILKDKTAKHHIGIVGKWTAAGNRLVIKWNNGLIETLTQDGKSFSLVAVEANGKKTNYTMSRIDN